MRIKILLFLTVLSCGILNAQDTIDYLVITEARMNRPLLSYVELTNMGTESIDLSEFEFGRISPWTSRDADSVWLLNSDNDWFMLPAVDLAPGESYVISGVEDWRKEQEAINPFDNNYRDGKTDVADGKVDIDMYIHLPESPGGADPTDSITPKYQSIECWNGRETWYIRHHLSNGDSVVVDQVGGVFDDTNGTNRPVAYDVAGFENATNLTIMYRKFKIKKGNIDFATGRGIDLEDSEWIPVPFLGDNDGRRASFWTVHNHGNYTLNDLTSETIDINLTDSVLTVPWGVRRDDSIMYHFDEVPGLAWHYDYAPNWADSAYISARTGDKLTVYAIGNELEKIIFDIEVAAPTADANIVVPKKREIIDKNSNNYGYFGRGSAGLFNAWVTVTNGKAGMDTIKHNNNFVGIPFAMRKDSLLKYLEKAPNATWEVIFVDGEDRTDLKEGDILRVTAEDGTSVKDYYISVDQYRTSHNALLGSITWPDIPDEMRDFYGWSGDTLPSFSPTTFNYQFTIPSDAGVSGVPALVTRTQNPNAKVEVGRAANLSGSVDDKTITFTVTAEDDTSVNTYAIQVNKEKAPEDLQKYIGDPFISQYVFRDQWANSFIEICNPNDEVLDLSDYMFVNGYTPDPAEKITEEFDGRGDWLARYRKYIPGYKWQEESDWSVERFIAVEDNNIIPLIQPKDVFVMTHMQGTGQSGTDGTVNWPARGQWDIDFGTMSVEDHPEYGNPWGYLRNDTIEEINSNTVVEQWLAAQFCIFKILNDSIKLGLKPATDPNDFELIEAFGSGVRDELPQPVGVNWDQLHSYTRKPHIYKPNPVYQGSFGATQAESEWLLVNPAYNEARGHGWPQNILLINDGLGSHFLNAITDHLSTVTSSIYKVTEGYSDSEEITGVLAGTTVDDLFANLNKANEDQVLKIMSTSDGAEKTGTDVVADSDTLVVLSADSVNTSKYILIEGALSDDAVLTSTEYEITVDGEAGTVTGFEYGALVSTIVENVTVPEGAKMDVVDGDGAYVSLKVLNLDTVYVDKKVSDDVYFNVVAEDGNTTILYQLLPDTAGLAPLVTSEVYDVDQDGLIIDFVLPGTTVAGFSKNVIPSTGSTFKIVDKFGFERVEGTMVKDDKVVVTDGEQEVTYYIAILDESKNYLAYITSQTYAVDQLGFVVTVEVTTEPNVTQFESNITASPDAVVTITDSEGAAKAADAAMADGDIITVVSGNGVTTVNYVVDVELIVGINDEKADMISVYPNPSKGSVNISGLTPGNRIQVYNIAGVQVQDRIAYQAKEIISLDDQPNGIYFLVVSDSNNVVGRYKLVRE